MPRRVAALSLAVLLGLASAAAAQAEPPQPAPPPPPPAPARPAAPQPPPPPPAPPSAEPVAPLKLQVVLSRYEGERKVASLPYVMLMDGRGNGSMNMGVRVAVPSTAVPPPAEGQVVATPVVSFSYQNVGTTINCRARAVGDGRFYLDLTVSEHSVLPNQAASGSAAAPAPYIQVRGADVPMFPTFSLTGAVVLANGETAEFGTATNPVTGQVTKVDVTLTVLR